MPSPRVKCALFGGAVVVGLILIIALVVHRSSTRDRICPTSAELFYIPPGMEEGECLRAGAQGPCEDYMAVVPHQDNASVGVCGCDSNHFDRPMVYNEETQKCYFIFTQAYCGPDQWLTVTRGQGPICDVRICNETSESGGELVPLQDGRCVELGKHDNVTCNKSEVVRFFKKRIYPRCSIPLGQSIGSIGVPGTDCPDGYFSTGAGHCQPDFDFD